MLTVWYLAICVSYSGCVLIPQPYTDKKVCEEVAHSQRGLGTSAMCIPAGG